MKTATLGCLSALSLLIAAPVHAQDGPPPLPTPYDFVSELDFECRPADGAPVTPNLVVRQLNPVLKNKIPPQQAFLYELRQVCVPVAKNGQLPGPSARYFIRDLDLACYRATAPDVNVELELSHLNPVLAGLPDEHIKMTRLEQVCVPVRKNDREIPPQAKQLASYFDLGCYGLDGDVHDAQRPLVLTDLNPVIRAMNFPDRQITLRRPQQLCVPIGKNNQQVPPGVLQYIEWSDFLKYGAEPNSPFPVLPLLLHHLNPLFAAVPGFQVWLQTAPLHLMVPVAKNGHLPPDQVH